MIFERNHGFRIDGRRSWAQSNIDQPQRHAQLLSEDHQSRYISPWTIAYALRSSTEVKINFVAPFGPVGMKDSGNLRHRDQ